MSDDAELVKAGVEGMVGGAVAPFAEILNKLAGPGAEELGLLFRDHIHAFRMKRFKRLMGQIKLMFDKSHREPQQVELKLLLPILENGSVEENDDLQDRWAALLVNSSGKNKLLPGAPDILKQLSPFEVLLLQMCYEFVCIGVQTYDPELSKKPLGDIIKQWYGVLIEKHNFKRPMLEHHHYMGVMIDNLTRLGLLVRKPAGDTPDPIYMSTLGFEFISLCQVRL